MLLKMSYFISLPMHLLCLWRCYTNHQTPLDTNHEHRIIPQLCYSLKREHAKLIKDNIKILKINRVYFLLEHSKRFFNGILLLFYFPLFVHCVAALWLTSIYW